MPTTVEWRTCWFAVDGLVVWIDKCVITWGDPDSTVAPYLRPKIYRGRAAVGRLDILFTLVPKDSETSAWSEIVEFVGSEEGCQTRGFASVPKLQVVEWQALANRYNLDDDSIDELTTEGWLEELVDRHRIWVQRHACA